MAGRETFQWTYRSPEESRTSELHHVCRGGLALPQACAECSSHAEEEREEEGAQAAGVEGHGRRAESSASTHSGCMLIMEEEHWLLTALVGAQKRL